MTPVTPDIPESRVLAALSPRGRRILSFREVAKELLGPAPDEAALDALQAEVEALERKGLVVRTRGEKLSLIQYTNLVAGRIAIRGEGRAWLLSGERGVPDLPIVRGGAGSALDGDFVLVLVEKAKPRRGFRGPTETGTVTKVLVRRRETVVGRIARGPDGTVIVPYDTKIDALLRVPDGKDMDAPDGIYVDARITAWPDEHRLAQAEVIELIGFPGDPGIDVEVVARKWGIPRTFTNESIEESERAVAAIQDGEWRTRRDLTRDCIVTIDGETARDFDDAISAEELPGGGFRLGIHIADVSHYVTPGSALDAEAFERGTSVYFPDRAVPMLPERLSNDLCSLRPREEKRTVTAQLTLDAKGETITAEFYRSVIHSKARLTYTDVAAFFQGDEPGEEKVPAEVRPMLLVARKAAFALRWMRRGRGSLDFDLPDADLVLGETGDVVAIVKAVRNEAHRLIEEFMLAANEAVARHLVFIPTPAMYRVHDKPDERKLGDLRAVLEPLGYDIPQDDDLVSPAIFQAILDQAEGKPEERFVSDLVLRAQKKALYAPVCRGHYALAATYYAHFTSPIRRYPDLVVHRALCEWIAAHKPPAASEAEGRERWLADASTHCSERERRAESAEREAQSWKKFVFLSKRVGEEFDAYVSAVVPFGLFITLEGVYADGLLPMEALEDDFYRYEDVEHRLVGTSTGRVFRLGDHLRVKLTRADFDKRLLDFRLAGASAPQRTSRPAVIERAAPRRPAPRGPRPPERTPRGPARKPADGPPRRRRR
ncbi:MAG: ribonuclease R [Holophagales bacterium]|nr:ribonuclease R [Holophagales bacterium]